MARLNHGSVHWLTSIVTSFGGGAERSRAVEAPAASPADIACLSRLGRDVCSLPGLFRRARFPGLRGAGTDAAKADGLPGSVTAIEAERLVRLEMLSVLGTRLHACCESLEACETHLPPETRQRLHDALARLETEYVRLCDAERFLSNRQVRWLRTGEADDDSEFTIVLERIVHAVGVGDEVETSVTQAAQAVASELLPYQARRE